MPDGSVAECYAKEIAEGVARSAYPDGFASHTFVADALTEPQRVKAPARIFLDSMSDLMGHWVPDDQIEAVLGACRAAHWHTFQLLTKNAPRLLQFDFPSNVWVGVSAPPTHMHGHQLSERQQHAMVGRQMDVLGRVRAKVRWMSIEPLSFDIAPLLTTRLDWAVIGAATNGRATYQPRSEWVENVLAVLDGWKTPAFFKGNLDWSPWREDFPSAPERATEPQQMGLWE